MNVFLTSARRQSNVGHLVSEKYCNIPLKKVEEFGLYLRHLNEISAKPRRLRGGIVPDVRYHE